jgi:hypothetical protein
MDSGLVARCLTQLELGREADLPRVAFDNFYFLLLMAATTIARRSTPAIHLAMAPSCSRASVNSTLFGVSRRGDLESRGIEHTFE